jgi:hypothetical protein
MSAPSDDNLAAACHDDQALTRMSTLWQAYSRHRYAVLFYSLLFLMVAVPFASTFNMPQIFIKLLFACLSFACRAAQYNQANPDFLGSRRPITDRSPPRVRE